MKLFQVSLSLFAASIACTIVIADDMTFFPRASAREAFEIPDKRKQNHGERSLENSVNVLQAALKAAGYFEQSWYLIGPGEYQFNSTNFAKTLIRDPNWRLDEKQLKDGHFDGCLMVLTRLEQISDSGKPIYTTNRWALDPPIKSIKSFSDYLDALLKKAPESRYRTLVFAIKPVPHMTNKLPDDELKAEQLDNLFFNGRRIPDLSVFRFVKSEKFYCLALIYEFKKETGSKEFEFVTHSSQDGREHLIQSGIWSAFKPED